MTADVSLAILRNVALVSEFGFAVVSKEACVKIYNRLDYLRKENGRMNTVHQIDNKLLLTLKEAKYSLFQSDTALELYTEFVDHLRVGDFVYIEFNVSRSWTLSQAVQGKTNQIRTIIRCRNKGLSQYDAERVAIGDIPEPETGVTP